MASTASTVDIEDGPILNKRDVHWKAYWSSEPTLFTSITHTSDTLWKTSKRACFHLLWTDYGIEPLEVAGAKIISEIRGTLTIWPHPHQLPHPTVEPMKRHRTTKRRKLVQQWATFPFVWRPSQLQKYQDYCRGRETGLLLHPKMQLKGPGK